MILTWFLQFLFQFLTLPNMLHSLLGECFKVLGEEDPSVGSLCLKNALSSWPQLSLWALPTQH